MSLDFTFQQTNTSLSNFSEFINLNWIEHSVQQTGKYVDLEQ